MNQMNQMNKYDDIYGEETLYKKIKKNESVDSVDFYDEKTV